MNKILIVDDEKNIRMMLKQCLVNENYQVETAVNGSEGLQMAEENEYDVILLDMKMPGLNGMEVLERLRKSNNKVNIVMMTAYGTIEKAVEAMKLGAIDFLSKPFTPEEIRVIVREVLLRSDLDESNLDTYEDMIQYVKKCIVEGDYPKAEEYAIKALAKKPHSPEPHNLLGILLEFKRKPHDAQKHYRAALALEPSYKPASDNLERTSRLVYTKEGLNLGDKVDGDE